MFSLRSKFSLAKASLTHNTPVYVQFYVTARCNLTCQQCNIIYANADVKEADLDKIKKIADNFKKIQVAMVLLTGGEPFARTDLHKIIYEFESRGIHVRMQTNGFATTERIHEAIDSGGHDISISLDSLQPANQDEINGGFTKSWNQAVRAIVDFSNYLPKKKSFASLGCVIQKNNLDDIEKVIRFGTSISWFTSVVPIHFTTYDKPRNFRTFDNSKQWTQDEIKIVKDTIETVRKMRNQGYLLYDSDEYLDDIIRFTAGEKTKWRDKNKGICDSPNLYFAVLPNGEFAPCCDFRLNSKSKILCSDPKFPEIYRSTIFRSQVEAITSQCEGCMYGSYPEMSISMRYLKPKLDRIKMFIMNPPQKNWPLDINVVIDKAHQLNQN